jgi:hypothetical protein
LLFFFISVQKCDSSQKLITYFSLVPYGQPLNVLTRGPALQKEIPLHGKRKRKRGRDKKDENAATGTEEQAKVKRQVGFFGIVLASPVASSTAHAQFVEAWRV